MSDTPTAPAKADAHHHGHGHPPHLAHHFDTPEQQFASGKLGMWIFLATEILMFGGLFCAYAIYRAHNPDVFLEAHRYLNPVLGGVNTLILIASSVTMAWGVRAAQLGHQRALKVCLALTIAGGAGFMVIKYFEYAEKIDKRLLWASHFDGSVYYDHQGTALAPVEDRPGATAPVTPGPAADLPGLEPSAVGIAPAGPGGLAVDFPRAPVPEIRPSGERIAVFFSIYYMMTGLHAIHVLVGMGLIGWVLYRANQGAFSPEYYAPVDITGLYWHLVDLIWIFLFPLLYLIH